MLTKNEFYQKIKALPKRIPSKTGRGSYGEWELVDNILNFTRLEKDTRWNLDVDVLYDLYRKNKFINTIVIKAATNRKVNSPSVAILMAIECIDSKGNRL
ncbi:MAG: hypothetical protein EOO06_13205 [Chitinophagaceae bacterium]|nr:MAG: hypothetical protein EOO06_13205 [Chitinophagaceae bacterium]